MNKIMITNLVGIYIVLLGISYAMYVIFVAAGANDAVASGLLSWSAAIFATIALLYTFGFWRKQKGSEVMSSICNETYKNVIELDKYIKSATSKIFDFPFRINNDPKDLWEIINPIRDMLNNFRIEFEIIKSYEDIAEFDDIENELIELIAQYQAIYFDYVRLKKTKKNIEISDHLHNLLTLNRNKFDEFKRKNTKVLIEYIFHRR